MPTPSDRAPQREGVGDVSLGAGVVVAEGLAVGGRRHQPGRAPSVAARMSALAGRAKASAWASDAVVDDEVDAAVRVLGVPPPERPAGVQRLALRRRRARR